MGDLGILEDIRFNVLLNLDVGSVFGYDADVGVESSLVVSEGSTGEDTSGGLSSPAQGPGRVETQKQVEPATGEGKANEGHNRREMLPGEIMEEPLVSAGGRERTGRPPPLEEQEEEGLAGR